MLHVEPGDVYWSLIEPSWTALNQSWDNLDDFLRASQAVAPKVLLVYAAHWCRSEVDNGGFHQFFHNTTGLLAPEAAEGFRAIGLLEWSTLLSEAMTYFGAPYPRERSIRLERLSAQEDRNRAEWNPFTVLDDRFHESSDAGRWDVAADAYAKCAA